MAFVPEMPRGAAMRLTDAKIRYLSEKLAAWLDGRDDVALPKGREVLALELARAIRDELHLEDALEAEVEQIIRSHRAKIGADVDVSLLRQKIKKQLARERGIVL
jgi:hypothetical protein